MTKNKTEINLSSSGLTRGSRNGEEQGRSMVEMLGVLAVVGVLSVGGIAGYTYAMNKHYANELLNGVSQRAVILKAQKAAGLDLSLREFNGMEVAGGTFGNAEELEDGSGFIIPVSGVKGAVCENLVKATEGTDIAIAKDDGETLTDITEEDCDDENDNDLVFVFETENGDNSDDDDNSGSECFGGLPKCGTQCCAEGTYCAQDGSDNTKYACAKPTSGCTKNSDCKDAEGNVDTTKYCKLSASDCSGPTVGTCTDKGTLNPQTLKLPKGSLDVYYSTEQINWWSVANLCLAHEKQMVAISDLGVNVPSGGECLWERGEDYYPNCSCVSDEDCSKSVNELYKVAGYPHWLVDINDVNSCQARRIYDGFTDFSDRFLDRRALCK